MQLRFPIIKPLNFIKESVESLDCNLTKPQKKNLMLILTAIITCSSLCLSTLSRTLLGKRSINTLSHFFSYAGLNTKKLMSSACLYGIGKMNLSGVSIRLAVDDTMKHHSRGAKKISNVYWLFDHVTQTNCNASCVVFVYLVVNERIRFPVGWRVFKKGGPSKWSLAIDIIDDVLKLDLKVSVVLFDSWFSVRGFIKQLEYRKLTFIGDMKSSNALEYRLPGVKSSIVRLTMNSLLKCGRFLLKKVFLGLKSCEEEHPEKILYETYSITAYVAAFKGKYKIIHSIDQRTSASKTFVCNELSWEAEKVLKEYSYRWMIEEFFGNAKGLCGLEEACIRSEQGGALALFLVSYVDLLLSIELWKGIHDDSKGRLLTVSAIYAAASEENLRSFLDTSNNLVNFEEVLLYWLATLEKKKKQPRRARKELAEMPPPDNDNSSTRSWQEVSENAKAPPENIRLEQSEAA